MSCALPYSATKIADAVRTPFFYPARGRWEGAGYVIVEIGPGRGDFLFHLARINSDAVVVGIEIRSKRMDKLIRRIERFLFKNIVLIQDDARDALPRFFRDRTIDEIYINFPDPWPKRRHAKNRAVNACLLGECQRVLKPKGTILIATDDRGYALEIANDAATIQGLVSSYPERLLTNMPDAYPTFFAQKWQRERRVIVYQKYQKPSTSPIP